MPNSHIKFDSIGIAQGLSTYDISVPSYQRDYSWKTSYVDTFLEDLSLAMHTDEPVYFLGSIVFIDRGENLREVVDGQQRLATTSLFLAAMSHISGSNSDISRAIDRMIYSGQVGKVDDPKMVLNDSDSIVFNSLIKNGEKGTGFVEGRVSHNRLNDAYHACVKFLSLQLKTVSTNEVDSLFQQWVKYLQFKTLVIVITVNDELNAFRMFETLNDRGMKVSQSDLIKNYLFSQSKNKLSQAQSIWSSIRGILEVVDEEDAIMKLIRYHLMSTNSFVAQKNIYRKVLDNVKGENTSISMLTALEKSAKVFVAISNHSNPFWKTYSHSHKKNIEAINLFDLTAIKPLLMASLSLNKAECEKVFKYALSATVRLLLASKSRTTSASVEVPLSECAVKISSLEFKKFKDIKNFLAQTIPNDREFGSEFMTISSSRPKLARYYLRSMENAENNSLHPSHVISEDGEDVSLEHVLPRKPLDNWPTFDGDEHVVYYRRLGNLALINGDDMGSNSFNEKKSTLKKSVFKTTNMIANQPEWTSKEIEDRQLYLSKLAVKAWPL